MSRRNYVTFIPENVVKYFARDDNVLDIKNIFKCYEVQFDNDWNIAFLKQFQSSFFQQKVWGL